MKLSARNQIQGTVAAIEEGSVMADVTVTLSGGGEIVSVITLASLKRLGLQVGSPVVVVVKSTDVMLGLPDE